MMTVVDVALLAAASLVFALKTSPLDAHLDAQPSPWDAQDFDGVHGLCALA